MICKPPLCGTWRLDIVDRVTGQTIYTLNDGSGWSFRFTKRENQPSDFQLTVVASAFCCTLQLVPWRHQIKAYRDGQHCMTWYYTGRVPVIEQGQREVAFFGVSPMWLALRSLWFQTVTGTFETTDAFTLLLDEADTLDPLSLWRDPKPVGQQIGLENSQVGLPLAEAWNQLAAGTLEWTEYGDPTTGEMVVRYGEITYNSGLTISDGWWENPIEPSQDGTRLSSIVRVESVIENDDETETLVVGWYPPLLSNGQPPRGSGAAFLPSTTIVPGLTTQAEADAVAKRIWEKTQIPDYLEDTSNTLTRRADGFCPCQTHPGAILSADLNSECVTFFDQVRLTELTVEIESSKEIAVSPTLIAGQA